MPHRMQLLHAQSAAAPSLSCSTGSCTMAQRMKLPGCHTGCNYATVCNSTQPPLLHRFLHDGTKDETTRLPHRMQLLHAQSAAAPSLSCSTGSCKMAQRMKLPGCHTGCNYPTVCNSTQPPLLHSFLHDGTKDETTRLPHRMQLPHSLQQHPASAAPQFLSGCHTGCKYSTVCNSTQPM